MENKNNNMETQVIIEATEKVEKVSFYIHNNCVVCYVGGLSALNLIYKMSYEPTLISS
jgi:hypothetical protein